MRTIWILFLCISLSVSYAQENFKSKNKEAQKNFEQANQLISLKQFEKAIEKLQTAIKIDNSFIAAYQQLGDLHRKLEQYPQAKENYNNVLRLAPDFHPLTIFGLAESEFYLGNYSAALEGFKIYSEIHNVSASSKKATKKFIEDCEFSIKAIQNPVPFAPKSLGKEVNSMSDEYLPVLTADEETLIFTRRTDNKEDFYESKKKLGQWTPSKYLSSNVNTQSFNEGSQCISPDGLYLFFTGCNRPDGLGRCDIYVSKREGNDWSTPFNLGPPVNTAGWESQPSISADGKILYFVSNRPGGLGGNDIWKTTLQNGGMWSEPINLGPQVNTAYDEHSPFIHPDGKTLYFASNGWPGLGKRDLYVSRRDDSGNWQKAENLGFPINDVGEQSGLTVSTDGKRAYFASDIDKGYGKMDLYSFDLPEALQPAPVTYVKGSVFDSQTNRQLEATVRITDLKDNRLIYDDSSDEVGEFLVTLPAGYKYGLTVERPGYLFYSEHFMLDQTGSAINPSILKIPLQKIETGMKTVLNNIFFETNKADILPESKMELDRLIYFLNINPKVVIEISGHTDSVGDERLNQVLSENRAKAVFNYLILNKISPDRLSFKGMGKLAPTTENSTLEGRRKNRRTEFRIVKM